MHRSIAEGHLSAPDPSGPVARRIAVVVGIVLACAAFALYWFSNPQHYNQYTHFVWQADAFLHGRPWFSYPIQNGVNTVTGAEFPGAPDNYYFQDVFPLRDAAGNDLGLTRERVRQIESRAKDKLRRSRGAPSLRGYLN